MDTVDQLDDVCWSLPSDAELASVASCMHGAAGGDGWSGDGVICLPVGAWTFFFLKIAKRWLEVSAVPRRYFMHVLFCWLGTKKSLSIACNRAMPGPSLL